MLNPARYRAFMLPKSHMWGIVDRNRNRYLLGIVAEDYAAAEALAKLLNREYAKWIAALPLPPEPEAVAVPYIYRVRDTHPTTVAISPPPKPEPPAEEQRQFSVREYVESAPVSEQRLMERLGIQRLQTPRIRHTEEWQ